MTYYPNRDRTDWRTLSTRTLIDAARDCPNELAIALGERLEELEGFDDEAHDLRVELAEVQRRCDAYQDELAAIYAAEEAEDAD
jgi:predicted  nucleic acid-binding Zn-ribbon protein